MADTLGEAVVIYGADVSSFLDGVNQMINASKDVSSSLEETKGSTESSGEGFAGLGESIMGTVEKGAQFIFFGTQAIDTLSELSDKIFEGASSFEQMQNRMDAFTGNASVTNENIANLKETFGSTGWDILALANTEDKMLAMGYSSEEASKMIKSVGGAVFALGGGEGNIKAIVNQLDRMKETGNVTAASMTMLVRQGIPAWDMLAEKLGVTVPQAMELVKKHSVDAQTAISALETGMSKQFGPTLAHNALTFAGAMNEAKEKMEDLTRALVTPALPAVEKAFGQLAQTLGSPQFKQFATIVGTQIGNALTMVVPLIIGLFTNVMQLVTWLDQLEKHTGLVSVAIKALGVIIGFLALTHLIGGIQAAITAFIEWIPTTWAQVAAMLGLDASLLPFIGVMLIVAAVILAVIVVTKNWGAISEWLTEQWKRFQAYFMTIWEPIAHAWSSTFQDIWAFIVRTWNSIVSFLVGVWDFLKAHAAMIFLGIATVIFGPIVLIAAFIISHWQQISAFLSGVWNAIRSNAANIWNSIISAIQGAINTIEGVIRGAYGAIVGALTAPFQAAVGMIQGILGGIGGIISNIMGSIHSVTSAASGIHIPGHQGGTSFFEGGLTWVGEAGRELVWLPRGSAIASNTASESFVTGAGHVGTAVGAGTPPAGGQTIILQVDGRALANAIGDQMARELRIQLGIR